MTLPTKNNGHIKMLSIRLDEDLKVKQQELSNANINVSKIIRDAIESAWCELKGLDKTWNNEV